jgi:NitT/TauT family transport system substrate-binding protein
MNKKTALGQKWSAGLVAAFAVALALSACASAPAAKTKAADALKVSVTAGSLTTLPISVGIDMGIFEKHGLTPEIVNSSNATSSTQLLTSGQLDIAALDISGTVKANQAGADIKIASGMATRYPLALVCRSDLHVAQGFPQGVLQIAKEGLSVGITGPGSGTDTHTRALLAAAGIDPKTANLVALGGLPQMIAAIQANRVDCAALFEPGTTQLAGTVDMIVDVQNGHGPDIINEAAFSVLAVSANLAKSNPEMITAIQSAMEEVSALLADPANADNVATKVAASFPNVDHDVLAGILRKLAPTFKNADIVTEPQFDATLKMYNDAWSSSVKASYADFVLPRKAN